MIALSQHKKSRKHRDADDFKADIAAKAAAAKAAETETTNGELVQVQCAARELLLDDLALRIVEGLGRVNAAARNTLESALDVGDLLIAAKSKVKYGEWGNWLDEKCRISDRTARLYMQLRRAGGRRRPRLRWPIPRRNSPAPRPQPCASRQSGRAVSGFPLGVAARSQLTDGIEQSDDPLIDVRNGAYAISFSRRNP
jgi:hypothetical protein